MIRSTDNQISRDVLIVDDTPANIGVLHKTLEPHGHKVFISSSGMGALNFLENNSPDLILLDIMMPGMDGFETCEKIKENDKTNNIPIIFITAVSETASIVKGFQLGAMDYITKPFRQEEVVVRVSTQLRLQKAMMELRGVNATLENMAYESSMSYSKLSEELHDRIKSAKEIEEKLKLYVGHLESKITELGESLEKFQK
jgi:DNA-binding response OmpR family regulator